MEDKTFEEKIEIFENERVGCVTTHSELLKTCKETKRLLDMNYGDLYYYIVCIQTSVILFSTISAFIQALGNFISMPSQVQSISSLIISTYITLILSLSKFFKLDERKESVHNLREKFAELHNKIRYRLDCLKPWKSIGYINKNNIDQKLQKWEDEKNLVYNDYFKIVETKETLFMDFERFIDTKQRYKYTLLERKLSSNYKRQLDIIEELTPVMTQSNHSPLALTNNTNINSSVSNSESDTIQSESNNIQENNV